MPVTVAELVVYGSVNRPEDDSGTVGGAIDTTARPLDVELGSPSAVEALSDGADTRDITIHYRTTAGVRASLQKTLNGVTPVAFDAISMERIEKIIMSAGSATRTVTVRIASGGAVQHTIGLNETHAFRLFIDAVSGASPKIYYEKVFCKNTNATLALLSAKVDATSDPSGKLRVGIAGSVNDSATATNRLTAPGGVSFVQESVDQNVPGTDLAATAAIGVWLEFSLGTNEPPIKSSYTVRLRGNTV